MRKPLSKTVRSMVLEVSNSGGSMKDKSLGEV
jgi:hypothetical protein